MATLSLIPNPAVLATQVVVFLASTVVIKKLYVEPYLLLRGHRAALTTGSQEEAARALAECDEISRRLDDRLRTAAGEAKAERNRLRDAALAKRQTILAEAEKVAKAQIAHVEEAIAHDLLAETSKIPSIVAALTDEVYQLALA